MDIYTRVWLALSCTRSRHRESKPVACAVLYQRKIFVKMNCMSPVCFFGYNSAWSFEYGCSNGKPSQSNSQGCRDSRKIQDPTSLVK